MLFLYGLVYTTSGHGNGRRAPGTVLLCFFKHRWANSSLEHWFREKLFYSLLLKMREQALSSQGGGNLCSETEAMGKIVIIDIYWAFSTL